MTEFRTITVEPQGHVLHIGLNRPSKRNAFTTEMIRELSTAHAMLEDDDDIRAGVVFAHGDHFTAGLDLVDVAQHLTEDRLPFAEGGRDPWRLDGAWTTPVVTVAHGWCMTLGIELLLASDIRVAAVGTRFSQMEVKRGIYPFGGATLRFPREAGWGNAMRWMLTGDEFDAEEALRMGLVQEICPDPAAALERGIELADRIAENAAPLGVRATLESAHRSRTEGDAAAAAHLLPDIRALFSTSDAAEGMRSFVERRQADFTGR